MLRLLSLAALLSLVALGSASAGSVTFTVVVAGTTLTRSFTVPDTDLTTKFAPWLQATYPCVAVAPVTCVTTNASAFQLWAAANPGIQVPVGSFLNARICNTSTTRTWYLAPLGRFLDTSSAALTAYGGIANPDVLSTAQAATLTGCGAVAPNTCNLTFGSNLAGNGLAQTDIQMSFGVGSIMTVNSGGAAVPSGTGIIYPNMKNEISKPRGIPPGKCFGQYLVGQSTTNALGGTGAAIYLGLRAYLYYDQ